MNEDRIVGTARNIGGKAQDGLGRLAGDTKFPADGVVNQVAGRHRICTARRKTAQRIPAQAVRQGASDMEDYVRRTIETRPYTTALVALCVGLLIGRMGRRY